MDKAPFRALTAIVLLVLVSLYFYWPREKTTSSSIEQEPNLTPQIANGKIVLKSFQSEEPHSSEIPREPTSSRKRERSREVGSAQDEKTNVVQISGADYVWLNNLSAKKAEDAAVKSDSPHGYSLSTQANPQQTFGVFDSENLFVVTDRFGMIKKVITGAFVVELQDMTKISSLANSLNLDLKYSAPQIHMAILQARNGQNLFVIEASLKAIPNVTKVTLEILGRGAEPQ